MKQLDEERTQAIFNECDRIAQEVDFDCKNDEDFLHTVTLYELTPDGLDLKSAENCKEFCFDIPACKDINYLYVGLQYFIGKQLDSRLTNSIASIKDKNLNGEIEEKQANEEIAHLEEVTENVKNTYAPYFNITDVLIDTFKQDEILNACAVVCGKNAGLNDKTMKNLMDLLKETVNKPIPEKEELDAIQNELQFILNKFSLRKETGIYKPFVFRANRTLTANIYRVYYKGMKISEDGTYKPASSTAKSIANEILKEISARLQRVTEN